MFVAVMFVLNGSAQQRLAAARGQIGSGIEVRTAGLPSSAAATAR